MTIHSDWARLLYNECPQAFLLQTPQIKAQNTNKNFGVGVIDGHLQLMCLHPGMGTWESFIQCLFVQPIKVYLLILTNIFHFF